MDCNDSFLTFLKDWGGHILAFIGILGSIWVYLVHDRKLKAQEKTLNNLQIKQLSKAEAKEKMADIRCNIFRAKSKAHVRIINAGPSTAYNVRIEILNQEELEGLIFQHTIWGPYEMINVSDGKEEIIFLEMGYTEHLKLRITWDDEFAKDRVAILNPQIN